MIIKAVSMRFLYCSCANTTLHCTSSLLIQSSKVQPYLHHSAGTKTWYKSTPIFLVKTNHSETKKERLCLPMPRLQCIYQTKYYAFHLKRYSRQAADAKKIRHTNIVSLCTKPYLYQFPFSPFVSFVFAIILLSL